MSESTSAALPPLVIDHERLRPFAAKLGLSPEQLSLTVSQFVASRLAEVTGDLRRLGNAARDPFETRIQASQDPNSGEMP